MLMVRTPPLPAPLFVCRDRLNTAFGKEWNLPAICCRRAARAQTQLAVNTWKSAHIDDVHAYRLKLDLSFVFSAGELQIAGGQR